MKKAQEMVDKGLYSNKSEVIRDALRRLAFKDELMVSDGKRFMVLFSADLHGNIVQYSKLFKKASDDKVDSVIIGGDIAPKDAAHRTVKDQRHFLEKELVPLIKKFNEDNKKRNHACSVYIIMGNDDFKPNYYVLKKYEQTAVFVILHNKCVKLHEDFRICGYPYVPLTPFLYKDWEKLDLIGKSEEETRKGFITEGKKARGNVFSDIKFDLKNRKNTIEKDLRKLLGHSDPRKIVLISHSPPYNTDIDMISPREHVGSEAVRKMIEEKQPLASLHGHIHETVDVSGQFMARLGKTFCLTSGNDHQGENIAVVKFNLYEPEKAVREII